MNSVDIENRIIGASPRIGAPKPASVPSANTAASGPSFSKILSDQLADSGAKANVKFSGHAQSRLASRNIHLTSEDIAKIGDGITKAAAKGAKESLFLTDKAALVVSVANRTVITAVDKTALKDNIFTNIDSAMII
ncbi:hypothetical protein CCAX7_48220 [Capsulimonas corticalis]|uniref:Uncharacterized protein n=1 Tax=Capsulimonas corticalis TaxID=2219043 RepID=A0A402CQ95_9BACT|nr:TIGR02530 family flagellar biosynthesis protein [Capsulimonas corticalis]BDI32771.1 hypothetical protein CCAX7_48220 [Capsulimonas corticalis]